MDSEIYPVFYYNGQRAGELRLTKEGLMTVIEADCSLREGVVRLAVYGDGMPKTLGVLIPEGGRLRIKKRYSRAQMAMFPSPITHAAPEGETETMPVESATEAEATPVIAEAAAPAAEVVEAVSETHVLEAAMETATVATVETEAATPVFAPVRAATDAEVIAEVPRVESEADEQRGSLMWWPEPTPWSLFSDTTLKAACRSIKGALMTFELDFTLLAIPVEEEFPELPIRAPAERRAIAGRRYAIVKVKDGTIYSD